MHETIPFLTAYRNALHPDRSRDRPAHERCMHVAYAAGTIPSPSPLLLPQGPVMILTVREFPELNSSVVECLCVTNPIATIQQILYTTL
jgi:hypothetical protein